MLVLGETYRAKAVLLTGGTGFLGMALVEKMLRSLPSLKRMYLLVRPKRGEGARERFKKDVLSSPAFSRLREELGSSFEERVAEKVRVLEGDVHTNSLGLNAEDLAELSREVDVVVHSAASVVFDAPLDAAVDSNVRGTLGLLALAKRWEKKPLFVHVSTAYVAGTKEGLIPEEEAEVAERLDQLRRAWVRDGLVERGNEQARALGWQDVYTFTKSLAERRVLEERGDLAVVILRPAIIESSVTEPHPGWIQGSRMADPIIMAFARGILREFPGDPKSAIDLVPVDHVVNAVISAVARGLSRRPESAEVYQVASGERNPLRLREFYEHVREYFLRNPLRDSGGRPVPLPEWSFPGRRRVEGRLRAELFGLKLASRLATILPEGHMTTDLRGRVARAEKRARMSFYYSRIYGTYTNMKSTFSSARTHDLYESLPEDDRSEFPFDIAGVDWRAWLQETHLPAITSKPGRKRRGRGSA